MKTENCIDNINEVMLKILELQGNYEISKEAYLEKLGNVENMLRKIRMNVVETSGVDEDEAFLRDSETDDSDGETLYSETTSSEENSLTQSDIDFIDDEDA
jgi:hypothetical protein